MDNTVKNDTLKGGGVGAAVGAGTALIVGAPLIPITLGASLLGGAVGAIMGSNKKSK